MASFKWLEGTAHEDDVDSLLYETTRVGTWRWPGTKDRVIVGWRKCLVADNPQIELKEPIHIADIERMTLASRAKLSGPRSLEPGERMGADGGVITRPGHETECVEPQVSDRSDRDPSSACAHTLPALVTSHPLVGDSRERCIDYVGRKRRRPTVLVRPDGDQTPRANREIKGASTSLPLSRPEGRSRVMNIMQGVFICSLLSCANVVEVDFGSLLLSSVYALDRPVPQTHAEAVASEFWDEWRVAEAKERQSLVDKDVLGPLQIIPTGKKVRTVRYVYKWKPEMPSERGSDQGGAPRRFKAKVRVACRDFHWLGGADVGETYAPTGRGLTFRIFMLIALMLSLFVHHVDIQTAFLNAELRPDEEYWMEPLPDDDAPPGWGYRLRKSIYGLRVAPRHWYKLLSSVLLSFKLQQSVLDPCLFWHWTETGGLMIVLIYVDDILVAATHEEWVTELKDYLRSKFDITDLGKIRRYLNVRITYERGVSLSLDQEEYVGDMLRRYAEFWNIFGKKPKKTPLPADAQEVIHSAFEPDTESVEYGWWKSFPYRSCIGSLLYLSLNTRPDIAFAVGLLARMCAAPSYGACYCVAFLLSYLSGTAGEFIFFSNPLLADWHAFVDADWAGDVKGRRSTSGFVIYLCGGPVAWSSKLMHTVASSSMQAEFQSYYYCITTLLFMKHLFEEVGMPYDPKVILFTDAEAAEKATLNPELSQRTKHFETKFYWVRSFVAEGAQAFIRMLHVGTGRMVADLETKVMTLKQLVAHFKHLMGQEPKASSSFMD